MKKLLLLALLTTLSFAAKEDCNKYYTEGEKYERKALRGWLILEKKDIQLGTATMFYSKYTACKLKQQKGK